MHKRQSLASKFAQIIVSSQINAGDKRRWLPSLVACVIAFCVPELSIGQETRDHQIIRKMLTKDQNAFRVGNGQTILDHRADHYFVATVPLNNGTPDFHGLSLGYTKEEMKKNVLDPDWKGGPGADALQDTALDWKSQHEIARIDIDGDYAVALSRIEHAWNDTTLNVRKNRGWNSIWFMRKIDGKWTYVTAVGGISSWNRQTPR